MGNPAGWNSGTLDAYAKDRDKAGNAEKAAEDREEKTAGAGEV